MTHVHLSEELLRAAELGDLPEGGLHRILVQHLAARCPTCAREMEAWRSWQAIRGTPAATGAVVATLTTLLERLPQEVKHATLEWTRARRNLRSLRRRAPGERIAVLRDEPERFFSLPLAELASREARRSLPARPEEAASWADVSRLAVRHGSSESRVGSPPSAQRLEDRSNQASQHAFAWAYRGNSLRVRGDFPAAHAAFETAWTLLRHGGVTDLAVHAEVAGLEAALYRSRRMFRRAEEHLQLACTLFRILRLPEALARTKIQMGVLYHQERRLHPALRETESARKLLDYIEARSATKELRLMVEHNRTDYLSDLGRFQEAAEAMGRNRNLYRPFPDAWTQLRRLWVEGKIAAGLGDLKTAHERYRRAWEGFQREKAHYDAALVALPLMEVNFQRGRPGDSVQIGAPALATFERLGVDREARETAALLHRATRALAGRKDRG